MKERHHFWGLDVDGRIILKLSSLNTFWGCEVDSSGSGLDPVADWTLESHKMRRIYWQTERLSASAEEICFAELDLISTNLEGENKNV
jgi:hypothetical protein